MPIGPIVYEEFFPFARTTSAGGHEKWLTIVVTNLSEDEIAMIAVTVAHDESINANFGVSRRWGLPNGAGRQRQ